MYAEERQRHIAVAARAAGRVDVAELSVELEVTTETIRRDLSVLERHGILRRVHGGAIPVERLGFEPALPTRNTAMTTEKDRIAKAALAELPDEGAILLDAVTTTARLAELLPPDRPLTVLTNSLPIALALVARPYLTVMLVGGRVRGTTVAAVDAWATDALAQSYVDVAFIGTNGVSVRRGLTTPDLAEASVKRAMITAARRVVLLADHTKASVDHLVRFGELADVDTFVTDSGLDERTAAEIASYGPRVVRA
jgi:DeoR family transcriptional regulator, fructose operon transcriptional repressor